MQEEVEQKTIALSVRTARMTSIVLQQALRKFLDAQKHKTHKLPHGKQTLKELKVLDKWLRDGRRNLYLLVKGPLLRLILVGDYG